MLPSITKHQTLHLTPGLINLGQLVREYMDFHHPILKADMKKET